MKQSAVFIDCGANKGQSISAFVNGFPSFINYEFSYIGYEPSMGFLPRENQQTVALEATARLFQQYFTSFQLYPCAVGIDKSWKIFWWAYGAGATGLINKALRMFLRDIRNMRFKSALRFFRIALVKYINLPNLLRAYNSDGTVTFLKLDIEGGEFVILNELLKAKIFPNVLLIEYHGNKLGLPIEYVQDIHRRLFDSGVKIYLWSADDNPPHIKLDRELAAKDC